MLWSETDCPHTDESYCFCLSVFCVLQVTKWIINQYVKTVEILMEVKVYQWLLMWLEVTGNTVILPTSCSISALWKSLSRTCSSTGNLSSPPSLSFMLNPIKPLLYALSNEWPRWEGGINNNSNLFCVSSSTVFRSRASTQQRSVGKWTHLCATSMDDLFFELNLDSILQSEEVHCHFKGAMSVAFISFSTSATSYASVPVKASRKWVRVAEWLWHRRRKQGPLSGVC